MRVGSAMARCVGHISSLNVHSEVVDIGFSVPICKRGKNLLDSSLLFWSGKRDSHSPGRGVLRPHVPSPSCTGLQKKEGRTFWILPSCFGAENGTRTRDLNLGKVALYQLSYFRIEQRRLSFASAKVGKKNALPNFWPLFFDFFVLLFPEEQGRELYVVDNKARFKILLRGARKFRCEPLSLPS